MLRQESTLKRGLYKLPDEPLGQDILIPAFKRATAVKGGFGWFSAGWIAKLAPGLATYLNHSDVEPIEFTVSPVHFPREREAFDEAAQMSSDEASEKIGNIFLDGAIDADAIAKHAISCLTWMLASEKLKLRIAVPTPGSNYHPKIWHFSDGDDEVLVHGSGNATGTGIAGGVEHMHVLTSWTEGEDPSLSQGKEMLDEWSRGDSVGIHKVLDLPQALVDNIIERAPERAPDEADYLNSVSSHDQEGRLREAVRERRRERMAKPRYQSKLKIPDHIIWHEGEYAHQGEAVMRWETSEQPERGLFEMATGSGKTITSLICAARAQERLAPGTSFLVVVAAPSKPIIKMWNEEISSFGVRAVVPSLRGHGTKREAMTRAINSLAKGQTQVLLVTNNHLCEKGFGNTLRDHVEQKRNTPHPVATMLIGDEVHRLGAEGFSAEDAGFFEKRLGLSATPVRQYDEKGTEKVFEFFHKPLYKFGLDKAIGFCLATYKYHVHAVTLNGEELEYYEELSEKIRKARRPHQEESEYLQLLRVQRRAVIETAGQKIHLLRKVLEKRGVRKLHHALIYASAKNPEQFDQVREVLDELGVEFASVTDKTNPTKLDHNFDDFKKGHLQVLLAKKILDEGVSIPSIREAFILASSTGEREWIQRRGRVLRKHKSKSYSVIHDFVALPPALSTSRDGRNIMSAEMNRCYAFAKYAENAWGRHNILEELELIQAAYVPSVGSPSNVLQREGDDYVSRGTPIGDFS